MNGTFVGKKFKINNTGEVWEIQSWIPSQSAWNIGFNVAGSYTLVSIKPIGLSFDVLDELLDEEFKSGRFEWIEDNAVALTGQCRHDYKKYIGFTETYYYCKKCNEKEI